MLDAPGVRMDAGCDSIGQEAGFPGPVQWRRSARARRVSLRIDIRSGAVVVTLPLRTGRPAGVALLATHAAWVRERLAALTPLQADATGRTAATAATAGD